MSRDAPIQVGLMAEEGECKMSEKEEQKLDGFIIGSMAHADVIDEILHGAGLGMCKVVTEEDGRYLASIDSIPGVMVYDSTPFKARKECVALALRTLALDRADERKRSDGFAKGIEEARTTLAEVETHSIVQMQAAHATVGRLHEKLVVPRGQDTTETDLETLVGQIDGFCNSINGAVESLEQRLEEKVDALCAQVFVFAKGKPVDFRSDEKAEKERKADIEAFGHLGAVEGWLVDFKLGLKKHQEEQEEEMRKLKKRLQDSQQLVGMIEQDVARLSGTRARPELGNSSRDFVLNALAEMTGALTAAKSKVEELGSSQVHEQVKGLRIELEEAEQRYVESEHRLSMLAEEIATIEGSGIRPTQDARASFVRDTFQAYFAKAMETNGARPINLDPALARRIEDLEEAVEDAESGNRSLLFRLEESKKELEEARERFGREMHIGAYLAFRHCGRTQEEARYELKKIEAKRQQLIQTAKANIRVLTGTQVIEALDDKAEAL